MKAMWKSVSWKDHVQKKAIVSSTRMQRKLGGTLNLTKSHFLESSLKPKGALQLTIKEVPLLKGHI